ncbi:MAG: hypothetical protein PHV42_00270 [Candidatus Pacebacteria bacterium]|nr:hypothetical protein [Candidatus Paceibacterota bacterium]
MLNQTDKTVLKLQKYVLDMEKRVLVKKFTLNPPEYRAFSYFENAMAVGDDDAEDGSMNDDEEEKK